MSVAKSVFSSVCKQRDKESSERRVSELKCKKRRFVLEEKLRKGRKNNSNKIEKQNKHEFKRKTEHRKKRKKKQKEEEKKIRR